VDLVVDGFSSAPYEVSGRFRRFTLIADAQDPSPPEPRYYYYYSPPVPRQRHLPLLSSPPQDAVLAVRKGEWHAHGSYYSVPIRLLKNPYFSVGGRGASCVALFEPSTQSGAKLNDRLRLAWEVIQIYVQDYLRGSSRARGPPTLPEGVSLVLVHTYKAARGHAYELEWLV
jgi:hypothetical protein